MCKWNRIGFLRSHQRDFDPAGRDPRHVDTRLKCSSGEVLQWVGQSRMLMQDSEGKESWSPLIRKPETTMLCWRRVGRDREVSHPSCSTLLGHTSCMKDQGGTKQPELLKARKLLTWRATIDHRQMWHVPGPACLLSQAAGILTVQTLKSAPGLLCLIHHSPDRQHNSLW